MSSSLSSTSHILLLLSKWTRPRWRGISNDDYDARFSLRGADYSRIGVYLDNILLHMPFHTVEGGSTFGSLTAFNGDMVEGLELHAGAWPVRFQDRTAGALDVHTRDGSRTQLSVRVAASASNAGLMAEGPLGQHGSWLACACKTGSTTWPTPATNCASTPTSVWTGESTNPGPRISTR